MASIHTWQELTILVCATHTELSNLAFNRVVSAKPITVSLGLEDNDIQLGAKYGNIHCICTEN